MTMITDYEPKKVFYYFNEISKIPHGSYNTKEIGRYLDAFGEEHGYEHIWDEAGNVIIKVPATPGYEDAAPVLLQGHMDMVCTVASGREIDMTREPIQMMVEGDWLTADGTTLGGDDGIAVAMMLALADSKEYDHPALELVFTVDEETGLEGAEAIDVSQLAARKMINIDSEEEGIITVSCAGGISANVHLPVLRENVEGETYSVTIGGLKSGHSGAEIHLELGNANILMGRVLYELRKKVNFNLVSMTGGNADNVICAECKAEIVVPEGTEGAGQLQEILAEIDQTLKAEYKTSDPGVYVRASAQGSGRPWAVDTDGTSRVLAYLMTAPYGIQNMSMDIQGLVETSLNLGKLRLEEKEMYALYALRSSVLTRQLYLQDKLDVVCAALGGHVDYELAYPAWEFRKDSPLRDTCVEVYREMYGEEPAVEAIHAGLECGLFAGKMGEEFDAVSIGPDMVGVHTADEKLSISSTKRVWEYLLAVLANCR